MNIGKNIQGMRKEIGLTQKQLAEVLGVAQPTIRKWESGFNEPNISTLDKLSHLFQCTMDKLIYGVDSDYEPLEEMVGELELEIEIFEKEFLAQTKDPSRIMYDKGYLDGLKMALVILED
jgi:transcriptional regulator with XRE-family HTH domain